MNAKLLFVSLSLNLNESQMSEKRNEWCTYTRRCVCTQGYVAYPLLVLLLLVTHFFRYGEKGDDDDAEETVILELTDAMGFGSVRRTNLMVGKGEFLGGKLCFVFNRGANSMKIAGWTWRCLRYANVDGYFAKESDWTSQAAF